VNLLAWVCFKTLLMGMWLVFLG